MSMTRTNARKYIAKAIGGANATQILDMAEEALQRTFEDWQAAKNWYFMLKDTDGGFTVASCVLSNLTPVVSAPVSGAFDGVNIGVGVTSTHTPASTTVLSVVRGTDGTITSITLSNTPSAIATETLTFSGNIPLICAQQEYNLYPDFLAPYHARMTEKRLPLDYIQYRYWNMKIIDHTIQGLPVAYTVYNPVSAETQNYCTYRFRVFRIPQGTAGLHYDTLFMQYYRKFNHDSDPVDIPDRYLYKFLDYAQWKLLEKKDATSDRLTAMQTSALAALQSAMTDDEEVCEEEEQTRLISQMESGLLPRPLWSNSQFSIYYGEL
jgi:hypothetical protein